MQNIKKKHLLKSLRLELYWTWCIWWWYSLTWSLAGIWDLLLFFLLSQCQTPDDKSSTSKICPIVFNTNVTLKPVVHALMHHFFINYLLFCLPMWMCECVWVCALRAQLWPWAHHNLNACFSTPIDINWLLTWGDQHPLSRYVIIRHLFLPQKK